MNTEYEIMLIDQNEANNFISPGWQKDLYKSNINNFVNHLRNGTFREHSVITVKKVKGGKYLLLDGQHKIEAIKISGISAVIDLRIVSGLDDKEMIAEYKAINSLKAPRLIDDIKAEVKGHHNVWLLEILDETKFPINTTLKGGVNAIRLDAVLNIFHNGKAKTLGRNNLSRKSLPLFLEDFKKEELKLIKEFFNFYRNCFGEPFKDN